jgi:glutathione S-transferase
MPSPLSIRPSGSAGRRSSAFVREELGKGERFCPSSWIADISLLGWVRNLIGFYEARELVGFDRFLHVQAWLDRGLARPAVQRGLEVTAAWRGSA